MQEYEKVMEIRNLQVEFDTKEGLVKALQGVNLDIRRGETLGLVGESGCGKSMTARAMLGIVPEPGKVTGGKILLHQEDGIVDIVGLKPDGEDIRKIRGRDIAMIFQEPMTSLSPVHTVGNQIMEAIMLHQNVKKQEARKRAIEMLHLVGIPNAEERVDTYPFEMSGGMRQRVMIAMALTCNPKILVADEATTALDVTIQAQILELLQRLQKEMNMAIIAVTHNLGVVASISQRVAVMYLGRIVEEASTIEIFDSPKHPYTQALLQSVPRISEERSERLLTIEGDMPDPYSQLPGCPFHPRCDKRIGPICETVVPEMRILDDSRQVRCHLYNEQGKEAPYA